MRELTASSVHANLLSMEGTTLGYFVTWSYVLLFLNLFLSVCKCAAITVATNILQPIFANFCLLLNFETRFLITQVGQVVTIIFKRESLSLATHLTQVINTRLGGVSCDSFADITRHEGLNVSCK
jgi:hypothetical protein